MPSEKEGMSHDNNRRWIFYDALSRTQSNPIGNDEAQMAILKMRPHEMERFFVWTTGWERWQPLKAYLESKQGNFSSSFGQHMFLSEDTVRAEIRDVLEMSPAQKYVEDEVTRSAIVINNFDEVNSDTKTHVPIENKAKQDMSQRFSKISLQEQEIRDEDGISKQFNGDDLDYKTEIAKPKVNFAKLNKADQLANRAERHELKIEILLISQRGKTFRSKSKNISLSGSLLEDSIPVDYCGGVTFDIVVINKQPCEPQHQRVPLKAKAVGQGLTQRISYVDITAQQKSALQNLLENYLKVQNQLIKDVA